jgi:fumarate reductase subunit D
MTARRPHTTAYRRDILWIAALVHRVSGLLLAAFLPLHFLVLGLALQGERQLDGFLALTANPIVKIAETGLVALLAVHLLGGLRVLLVEATTYRERQKSVAAAAFIGAGLVGLTFFALAR